MGASGQDENGAGWMKQGRAGGRQRTASARRGSGFTVQLGPQMRAPVRWGTPGGAPAALDRGEADQGGDGQGGEDQEAGLVAAGGLLL